MSFHLRWVIGVTGLLWCCAAGSSVLFGQEGPAVEEVQAASKKMVDAFNSGKADDVSALFLSTAEIIDEEGNVYQGQAAIKELLTTFFEKFPGAQMMTQPESLRVIGSVAIEDGTRATTTNDGTSAEVQYTLVLAKSDLGWQIASIHDRPLSSEPTSGEMLQPLEWLIGDWVNEGADAKVNLSYQWSEDGNFILGDILVVKEDQTVMKSTQRIGWDPLVGKPRSWMFDSDGGFAESTWTQLDDTWSLHSTAVLPNGLTGSANVLITLGENGRYVMSGTNRVVGNVVENDYEITVVKQPPAPTK